ncbi:MAG: patatin family protein [Xanthomonadaceae bacterium]|nr:patatin family protein [Rhodospirillaceae bacterium]NIA17753.1 patatin family protein [Xanthomonadaceae bacterium]
MTNKKYPKIGLALGSGGVKGLAHIGVIKVLKANNIPIDYITGSSIGALVGAFYAANKNINKLEKIALEATWRTGLSVVDPTFKGGLVKGERLENLIKIWLTNDLRFNDLKIPLVVIATDLITGKEVHIKQGNIIKAIRASSSVPIVFQPVKYKNKLLADGGLSNPLPDEVARAMGADIVIAVNLDNVYFNNGLNHDLSKNINLTKVPIRALNILRYHLARNSLKTADILIEPKVGEIGLVGWSKFFNSKEVKKTIKAGEKATLQILPQIKKILYGKSKTKRRRY